MSRVIKVKGLSVDANISKLVLITLRNPRRLREIQSMAVALRTLARSDLRDVEGIEDVRRAVVRIYPMLFEGFGLVQCQSRSRPNVSATAA
jgi:hypothetical protein